MDNRQTAAVTPQAIELLFEKRAKDAMGRATDELGQALNEARDGFCRAILSAAGRSTGDRGSIWSEARKNAMSYIRFFGTEYRDIAAQQQLDESCEAIELHLRDAMIAVFIERQLDLYAMLGEMVALAEEERERIAQAEPQQSPQE